MELSSWFRRSQSKRSKKQDQANQQELLGVTQELIDHLKSFTLDTFRNFPFQDDEEASYDVEAATTSGTVRKDLSDWQEQHAFLVLSRVKELAHLRFKLCPGYLKEQQFWRIYFMLVKSHVAKYEVRAIRLAKLKSMAMENQETSDTGAYEVEMAETKQTASLAPSTP
ncbi:hypothetical protein Dsin_024506 [Dipteronia sinensis]|uniref:BSD domain-containing protein n=1 Tax=Dipteronia sinensis TaxID=43782 RepID=A0AAD9ZUB6_9ROSI|nr:hypothetical protein Dsin_024506 [Dipteronia sinensis]